MDCVAGDEGEAFPIEVAAQEWRWEDWEVPTRPNANRNETVRMGHIEYQWAGKEVEYLRTVGTRGKKTVGCMANSVRANQVSRRMVFACPVGGCKRLVRKPDASRTRNLRVKKSTVRCSPQETEKSRVARARRLAARTPLRAGDGCGYCAGNRHRAAMRLTQIKIAEGLKWGEYYLIKFPEGCFWLDCSH